MKREGFLDEIEKIVDDNWDDEKKEINTRVDRSDEEFAHWMKHVFEVKMRADQRKSEIERSTEYSKRMMWDSPYSTSTVPESKLNHKCDCGKLINVTYISESRRDSDLVAQYLNDMRREFDSFYCPNCTRLIRVMGKIVELRINMTE